MHKIVMGRCNMKKILFLLTFLLLSGCTAEYNLEYKNNVFSETFKVESKSTEYCADELCSYYYNSYYNNNICIDYYANDEELAAGVNLSKYKFYNKSIIDNNEIKGINLDYVFSDPVQYSSSFLSNSLFESVIVNDSKIQAYNIKNVFVNYPYLDEIVITFSTDKFVSNVNSDKVNDDKYYWYINKDNYKNKTIYVEFDEEANLNNTFVDDGYLTWNSLKYILLMLIVVLLIIVLIVYEKVKNSNK